MRDRGSLPRRTTRAKRWAVATALLAASCAGEAPEQPSAAADAGFVDTVPPLPDAEVAPDAEPSRPEPAKYLVLWTTPLRSAPRKGAETHVEVPRGTTVARDVDRPREGAFVAVRFDGKTGWLPAKRLAPLEPHTPPREVAIAHPNAFFKRQVYHPVWNPTGPLTSGNCAPTSLAMAAMIFGREPAGLTVERSIDRVRRLMHKPSDSGGASVDQVRTAAAALDLRWRATARGSLGAALDKGHVVVLTGTPGDQGRPDTATAYQRAFRDAGYDYTFDGPHSILVIAQLKSGDFLVADPLSKIGSAKLARAQLADFYARWGGEGTAIWRD